MPDVFISYSRKNKEFVQRVHAALAAQKRDIWVDWEDIPLTADWWSEICTGIEAADSILVVMTPESMGSPICAMEVDHAIRHGKRLVPIVREMPDEKTAAAAMAARELDDNARKALGERQILDLAKQNWNALSRHNWLFFNEDTEFDNNFQKLVGALDTDLDHVKQHTRLLVRAREWETKAKDSSFLLSGTDITDAEKWIAQNVAKQPSPLPLHAEYIGASRNAANRRQRMLLIGVSIAFVISLALTILSFVLYRQAETSRELADINAATAVAAQATAERRAEESGSVVLAANAQAVSVNDPFLAYALAINAASIDNPPPAAQESLGILADMDAIRSFDGHQGRIDNIIFSPDGQHAYSSAWDGRIIQWEVATGEMLNTLENGYLEYATFSYDARYAAVPTEDYEIYLVDLASGETVNTLSGHNAVIISIAFSADGRYLISGSGIAPGEELAESYEVIIWDVATGEPIQTIGDLETPVNVVNLNPDGSRALVSVDSAEDDGQMDVHMFDVATGETLGEWHYPNLLSAQFTPDGTSIWFASDYGIDVWDNATGENLYLNLDIYPSSNFAFNLADEVLYFGDYYSNTMNLWGASNYTSLRLYVGHNVFLTAIAISPDGRYVLSGDNSGGMILWDAAAHQTRNAPPVYFAPNVASDMSADGQTLLWTDQNGNINHSHIGDFTEIEGLYAFTTVALSPDAQTSLIGSQEGAILRLDNQESVFQLGDFSTLPSAVTQIAYSVDGQTVFTGTADGAITLWHADTAAERSTLIGQGSAITVLVGSPDGRSVLSATEAGSVTLWDIASGQVVRPFAGHSTRVRAAAFSFDGRYLLTGDNSGILILWEVETSAVVRTFSGQGLVPVSSVAFSPDGLMIAAGFENGTLTVWDAAYGTLLRTYLAHTRTITDIIFSEDGQLVNSISTDGTLMSHITVTVPNMIDWFYINREVPELTCAQRLQYNALPYCDDNGVYPTSTPYPTLTPTP